MDDTKQAKVKTKVGVACQGGVISAGTFDAGVMQGLFESGVFDKDGPYELAALSGTSSGALVAAVSWAHSVLGRTSEAPAALERLWKHVDYGCLPNTATVDAVLWGDRLWEINPMYRGVKDWFAVPWMRHMFTSWVESCLPLEEVRRELAGPTHAGRPAHLVLGAAEVRTGEVRYFHLGPADTDPDDETVYLRPEDLSMDPVLASGSYADVNGYTTIPDGPGAGLYCDGAWATNPPLTPLIDCGVQEIWVVETFPKKRLTTPRTHAEREDRKEELWQNSLVEHELRMIRKVNEWLADKSLKKDGKRQITVKYIEMEKDLPVGAKFVNAWPVMREMMSYGQEQAKAFLHK